MIRLCEFLDLFFGDFLRRALRLDLPCCGQILGDVGDQLRTDLACLLTQELIDLQLMVVDGRLGLFKVSVSGDRVERIVEGQAFDPVWSPTGELIVYTGQQVNAFVSALGVRPDGTPVELPPLKLRIGGRRVRFLPDGRGLIHLKSPANYPKDFWLLDLSTMQDRRLTRLDDVGTIGTCDVTPDGKRIVFDRVSEDSDIVLIELQSAR